MNHYIYKFTKQFNRKFLLTFSKVSREFLLHCITLQLFVILFIVPRILTRILCIDSLWMVAPVRSLILHYTVKF